MPAGPQWVKLLCTQYRRTCCTPDEEPVAVFSMEMSASSLAQRMIHLWSVNSHSMRTGKLEERDWNRIDGAIQQIKNAPIYIDDTPSLHQLN